MKIKFFPIFGVVVVLGLITFFYLFDAHTFIDGDEDGVPRTHDNCVEVKNENQVDNNPRDGIGDACSDDYDNDGVIDMHDNCPDKYDPKQPDLDNDGIGDDCDPDKDNDGIVNEDDTCPVDKNTGSDEDGDGYDDACDNDRDNDEVIDMYDNCPNKANPKDEKTGKQPDLDNDGIGDACDEDYDNDGCINKCARITKLFARNIFDQATLECTKENFGNSDVWDIYNNPRGNDTVTIDEDYIETAVEKWPDSDKELLRKLAGASEDTRNMLCLCDPNRHRKCKTTN